MSPRVWFRLRPDVRSGLLIVLIALAMRTLHFIGLLGDPLIEEPRMDPLYHDAWARRIAGGELIQDTPFFRAPLYAYFLAAIYVMSGGSILAARGVQLLVGVLMPVLVWRIGRKVFSPGVAVAGGVIAAVYPLALRFEGDLLLEGLFVLLAMAALLQHLATLENPTRRGWFLTGLWFGLAAVTRPNVLVYVVAIPLAGFLARSLTRPRRPAPAPRRSRAGRGAPSPRPQPFARGPLPLAHEALLVAAGLVIPILPVTLHNAAAGDWAPIATQAGVNFYIGNNPQSDGFTAIAPGTRATWGGGYADAVALAERARGRPLRPSEVSDHWIQQGLGFIVTQPGAALRLFARKVYLFWWGAEISNNEHVYFLRRYSLPLRSLLWHRGIYMPFGLLAPLGLLGLVLAARRLPRAAPLVVYVVAYMGSVVLFFVCARFRYPVVPILILFAVYAVAEMIHRRVRPLALGVAATLILLLNVDPYGLRPAVFGSQALSYLDLGVHYARSERPERALELLRRASELDPGHPGPYLWTGIVHRRAGRLAAAETALRAATRGDPVLFADVVAGAHIELGYLYRAGGETAEALRRFQGALSLRPDDLRATLEAGLAAQELGQLEQAERYFRRVVQLEPGGGRASDTARRELARLAAPR